MIPDDFFRLPCQFQGQYKVQLEEALRVTSLFIWICQTGNFTLTLKAHHHTSRHNNLQYSSHSFSRILKWLSFTDVSRGREIHVLYFVVSIGWIWYSIFQFTLIFIFISLDRYLFLYLYLFYFRKQLLNGIPVPTVEKAWLNV